ncbi:MAG: GNAT family N-acetyltransferase [Acidimicrobiia bacterium]
MSTTTSTALEVAELRDLDELRRACELFVTIWGRSDVGAPVVPELLRAISHAGGYVAGARDKGELVGASMGFLGRDADGPILHSHITGVHPSHQGRGVGLTLKRHQQRWAAEHGIDVITWTFDPLVRRNGRFNLTSLGAIGTEYLCDFYGEMDDALNRSDPTDRLVARLTVDAREREEPDLTELQGRGAEIVLAASSSGQPEVAPSKAAVRLALVPEDIVAIRGSDPGLSLAWRTASREAMGNAIADGLRALRVTRDGWYVFAENEEAL